MSGDNTHVSTFVGRETVSDTLRKMGHAADETGKKFSGMGKLIGGVALGNVLTGALHDVVNFAKQSVGAYETVGAQVLTLRRMVGGSAESASRLRFALKETGLSVEDAGKSLKQFAKHVEANDKAIKTMRVSTRDAHGNLKDFNTVLLDTADRFAHMPAGIEKTALATNLFGRQGLQMLPFLEKGKAGLQELEAEATKYGLVLTQNNLDAIRKNIIAHREFHAALQGAQLQLGVVLLPILTSVTKSFSEWLIQIRPTVAALATGLKPTVDAVISALKVLMSILKYLADTFGGSKDAAKLFTDGIIAGTTALAAYKIAARLAKIETFGLNAALAETPLGAIAALTSVAALLAYRVGSKQNMAAPGTPAFKAGVARIARAHNLPYDEAEKIAERDYYAHTSTGETGAGTSHKGGKYTLPTDPNAITDPFTPQNEAKAKASAFNLAKEVAKSYVAGLTGSSSAIGAAIDSMITVAKAAAVKGKTDPTGLVAALRMQQAQLQTLAADRDLTITRLTNAQANLKSLQDQAVQLADQIATSVTSSYSITSGSTPQTLNEMLGGMTRHVDRAKQLATALSQLRSQGLDPTLLKDIASAGTERGLDVAQQILIGGAAGVASLNTLQSAIAGYARDAGATVSQATYEGGINTAKALIDGLTKDKANIVAAIEDLAASVETIFDKSITALSKKLQTMADLYATRLGGLSNNYSGDSVFTDPSHAGSNADPNDRPLIGGDAAKAANATNINVTVNAQGSLDGAQAAQKIVTLVQGLNRSNGARVADW